MQGHLPVVLVRYLIPTIFIDTWIWFDTRYSILDTFVVNEISSTYSGATWNDCAMSIFFFFNFVMKHSGENEIPILSKIRFSLKNPIFSKTRNSGGCPLLYTTFRKHRNPVFGHFPSFPASSFMPRVINIPSISDTMWCKPGVILRTL